MIPPKVRRFFWDTNPESFDPIAYPAYTITRILEYGDEKAVAWLKETFAEEEIKHVIRAERRLTRRSANFWALVYRIPLEEVAALKAGGQARRNL
jgi:hypothetical protein